MDMRNTGFFNKGLFLMLGFFSFIAYANATLISIDFEDRPAGDVVTNDYSGFGVTFDLVNTPAGYSDGPTIRNIHNRFGSPNVRGKTLVPGDNTSDPFYDISLNFSLPVNFLSFYVGDGDERLNVNVYNNSTLVFSNSYFSASDFPYLVTLGALSSSVVFNKVILDVVAGSMGSFAGGPEFFDNFKFNLVGTCCPPTAGTPEPGTMALLSAGLIVAARKRKKRTAFKQR